MDDHVGPVQPAEPGSAAVDVGLSGPGAPPVTAAEWGAPVAPPASAPPRAAALVMGMGAAVGAAVVWALVAHLTNHDIGWMAIGVGWFVGFAMRAFGARRGTFSSVTAGALAVLGVGLGLVLATIDAVSRYFDVSLLTAIEGLRWGVVAQDLSSDPLNWLFLVLAVLTAVRLVRR
ncbi:MAG TPA: hypothetical protein VMI11_07150 [Actinomycetes bacterium]|nr:hypothetical protein [Actinomycetes bacterium]